MYLILDSAQPSFRGPAPAAVSHFVTGLTASNFPLFRDDHDRKPARACLHHHLPTSLLLEVCLKMLACQNQVFSDLAAGPQMQKQDSLWIDQDLSQLILYQAMPRALMCCFDLLSRRSRSSKKESSKSRCLHLDLSVVFFGFS